MKKVTKIIYRIVIGIIIFAVGSVVYGVVVEIFGHGLFSFFAMIGMFTASVKFTGTWDWMKRRRKKKNKDNDNLDSLYFAYGSNMLRCRLEERVGSVVDLGSGTLSGYKIKFNKKSTNGSGKTNIVQNDEFEVLGVIYKLSEKQIAKLDKDEQGYTRGKAPNHIHLESGAVKEAETYLAKPERIKENLHPTRDYLDLLVRGAEEHGFRKEYIEFLKSVETKKPE